MTRLLSLSIPLLLLLLLLFPACARCESNIDNPLLSSSFLDKHDIYAQLFGNDQLGSLRLGVSDNRVAWGLNLLYSPSVGDSESDWAIGLFGLVETPSLGLLDPNSLPPFWSGLAVAGFADLDIAYSPSTDNLLIFPGAGLRIEPTETMSLCFRVFYPTSSDDDAVGGVDLNSVNYSFGLLLRF